jgi:2-iminoacetate synthase
MPFAGNTISTRERRGFRDNVIGLCVTKISAGVKTSVGGYNEKEKGDAQFEFAGSRSVSEIVKSLENKGLQPVYTDYIRI